MVQPASGIEEVTRVGVGLYILRGSLQLTTLVAEAEDGKGGTALYPRAA
jgi:hypothetical protein